MSDAPMSDAPDDGEPVTLIRADAARLLPALREAWRGRGLALALARRDVAVIYKQAVLGCAWTLLQPLAAMAVLSVVIGRIAGMPSDGAPYPLFVLAGLVVWQYAARAVSLGATSLVHARDIVTKTGLPRILLPTAAVLPGLVDLGLGLGLLVAAAALWLGSPGWPLLLLPAAALLAAVTVLAAALWLSAMNALWRDVGIMVPFLLQIWMFLTPVLYPASAFPAGWAWALWLNPLATAVETVRWCTLGTGQPPPLAAACTGAAVAAALLAGGAALFHRLDRSIADRI